tara:strand:- start:369 stop:842 length:474 start_codon:yes stop_codon:yes gene_type:complete
MLNKKGHIGTTLMVLGALVLVIATLYSFAIFGDKTGEERAKLNKFISDFSFEQKYVSIVFEDMIEEAIIEAREKENFEKEFRISLKQIAERRRDEKRKTNLFAKIINEPLDLTEREGDYVLVLDGVFVKFEEDKSVIERKFDFKIEFSKSKIFPQSL